MSDEITASPIYDAMPPISRAIWKDKYRLTAPDGTPIDIRPEDTLWRVARHLALAETGENLPSPFRGDLDDYRDQWAKHFFDVMQTFEFMPAGRIVAGAGAGRNVTLSNCYVMGTIPDSMDGIFEHLKEAALTMQAGGGIGYDFSPIRPKGAEVKGVGAFASGPLSFMDCWDAMCRTVMSAGSRRGAMMATMGCWHPDILDFITAKADSSRLRMFNVSVLCTDAFMDAVLHDKDWTLYHEKPPAKGEKVDFLDPHGNTVYAHKVIKAKELWDHITRCTYDQAEPGVIFIDRINKLHNLWWIDDIRATNPCGEKAMGPYDSCLLGSVNLAMFVESPFTSHAKVKLARLIEVVKIAIRMMDNVIDVNYFPLPQQAAKARETRQLGLGITGLADMLAMLGMTYGSLNAAQMAGRVMKTINEAAYWASIELARQKGSFPAFDADKFLGGENFAATKLDDHARVAIREMGIRNSLLTSIAPTGTISIFMNNVSSGMEPIFATSYTRKVLQDDGSKREELVVDYAVRAYADFIGDGPDDEPLRQQDLPPFFVTAQTLTPTHHVRMQAALQDWVDSSISKTINCPEDISFEDFQSVYLLAYQTGCKGCTTYRPNEVTGSVLSVVDAPAVLEKAMASEAGQEAMQKSIARGIVAMDEAKRAVGMNPIMTAPYGAASNGDSPSTRPEVLDGKTYKIKIGSMEHAVYVNVTHIPASDDEPARPFEVFISTKDPSHQVWMTALSRMVSAIFRRPHDSTFVVEELKAVFDPTFTGFWHGKQVPSVVAAIGRVIERHMETIGYLRQGVFWRLTANTTDTEIAEDTTLDHLEWTERGPVANSISVSESFDRTVWGKPTGPACPKCFSTNLKRESGCTQCLDCGHSKCG